VDTDFKAPIPGFVVQFIVKVMAPVVYGRVKALLEANRGGDSPFQVPARIRWDLGPEPRGGSTKHHLLQQQFSSSCVLHSPPIVHPCAAHQPMSCWILAQARMGGCPELYGRLTAAVDDFLYPKSALQSAAEGDVGAGAGGGAGWDAAVETATGAGAAAGAASPPCQSAACTAARKDSGEWLVGYDGDCDADGDGDEDETGSHNDTRGAGSMLGGDQGGRCGGGDGRSDGGGGDGGGVQRGGFGESAPRPRVRSSPLLSPYAAHDATPPRATAQLPAQRPAVRAPPNRPPNGSPSGAGAPENPARRAPPLWRSEAVGATGALGVRGGGGSGGASSSGGGGGAGVGGDGGVLVGEGLQRRKSLVRAQSATTLRLVVEPPPRDASCWEGPSSSSSSSPPPPPQSAADHGHGGAESGGGGGATGAYLDNDDDDDRPPLPPPVAAVALPYLDDTPALRLRPRARPAKRAPPRSALAGVRVGKELYAAP